MNHVTRILLVEAKQPDIDLFRNEVQKSGIQFSLHTIPSFDTLPDAIQSHQPDIIACDYSLTQLGPIDAINVLKSIVGNTPFIIYSGILDEEIVVQCMKAGASDYIFKQHPARLGAAIHHIIENMRIHRELIQSRERFNTLAKVSTVGIFLANAEGEYLYVNERWSSITGLTSEQAFGSGFLTAVHSHDRKRIMTEWEHAVKNKVPFHSEYRISRGLDAGEVWVLGESLPEFMDDGTLAGFVGTITDITYRMHSEIEIDASRKQLRALTNRLQSVREEERTHISREIHDDLGQSLTGLRMDLVWLSNKIDHQDEKIALRMKSMIALTDATIHKVRKLATDLRPGILDDIGLAAAIEWQAKDIGERSGIRFTFDLQEDIQLESKRSTAFFRIFQESMTNVIRHSDAKNVHVSLRNERNMIVLTIDDDGKGIAPNEISHPRSVGILGMKERAAVFNGEVQVAGSPRKGTTVRIRIPQPAEQ